MLKSYLDWINLIDKISVANQGGYSLNKPIRLFMLHLCISKSGGFDTVRFAVANPLRSICCIDHEGSLIRWA